MPTMAGYRAGSGRAARAPRGGVYEQAYASFPERRGAGQLGEPAGAVDEEPPALANDERLTRLARAGEVGAHVAVLARFGNVQPREVIDEAAAVTPVVRQVDVAQSRALRRRLGWAADVADRRAARVQMMGEVGIADAELRGGWMECEQH